MAPGFWTKKLETEDCHLLRWTTNCWRSCLGEVYQELSFRHVKFQKPIKHLDTQVKRAVGAQERNVSQIYKCVNHQYTDGIYSLETE